MSAYPVLRYPGNVTNSDQAQPGALLGWDEMGRPYEVIDAEFIPGERTGDRGHTNVYLQYAKPETIRTAVEAAGGSALQALDPRGRPTVPR